MNRLDIGRVCLTFLKVFLVLFIILLVLPFIVDHFLYPLSEGIMPENNSIIVFKEFIEQQEFTGRFVTAIRKIFNFM